jgi:hypothetical protein
MKKILNLCLLLSTFFSVNAQINLVDTYSNITSPTVGTFQNITFREGGFSGLNYIPNTNGTEFWTVTDRGVNIDAANANTGATFSSQFPTGCVPTYDKIYGFPTYAPKIMRIKIVGNEVQILQTISIKRPNGTDASGLLNPTGFGSTASEIASTNVVTDCANFNANTAQKDIWGIDSEGIDIDAQGNFWICEEGGPTIWKVNSNGIVLKRYTPYALSQPEDVAIDACFGFRRNNRGFEGITITPNGKVYAIIQSPMYYKNVSGVPGSATLGNSRIHRILEIDTNTGSQKMYAYVNDGQIGTANDIRPRDQKIGDLKAINNTTFLVIEQGLRGAQNVKKLYKIDLTGATEVQSGINYANNTKTLEELDTPANLTANNVIPVTKTLMFDLLTNGWPSTIEKAEGIAIIDANTIVICNDNDYGQFSPTENGIATINNQNCSLYKYSLLASNALQNYIPNNNQVLGIDKFSINQKTLVYPNPFNNIINIKNIDDFSKYKISNLLGVIVEEGTISESYLNLENLKSGIYYLIINNQSFKIVKK